MMDLSDPDRRPRSESIVPMINVVFLLLIFFLMTAQIAPPEPFEVAPPQSENEVEAEAEPVLYVDREGQFAFAETRGDAAIAALAAQSDVNDVIQLRADGRLAADRLARLLGRLAEAGLSRVELVVVPK